MIIGNSVHVVPIEGGGWQVAGTPEYTPVFRSRGAAIRAATAFAKERQPSQVVVSDISGKMEPVVRYQLPYYCGPLPGIDPAESPFEAATKLLAFSLLAAAGIVVLSDLVKKVEGDLKRTTGRRTVRKPRRGA